MQVHVDPYMGASPPDTDTDPDPDPSSLSSLNSDPEFKPDKISVEQLRVKWNLIAGVKPCKKIEGALLVKIKKLLKEHSPTWWDELFLEIQGSAFLTGRTPGRDGKKPFQIDLDWATGPINLGKILSGKYIDDGKPVKRELKVAL